MAQIKATPNLAASSLMHVCVSLQTESPAEAVYAISFAGLKKGLEKLKFWPDDGTKWK